MKICDKCGERNFYEAGDKIECKACGKDLDNNLRIKDSPEHIGNGCFVAKKQLLHDELPFDFTHCDY